MKKEFETYFTQLGIDPIIRKRIEQVLGFYEIEMNLGTVDDIFINDYYTKDGIREFSNVCLFSSNYLMEIHDFLNEEKDVFDFVHIDTDIIRLEINKKNFNMKDVTPDSRLYVDATTNTRLHYTFKASRNNCNQLAYIITKYLINRVT